MFKNFVVLTDTHLGMKNHNQFWADLTENLFNEIIDLCMTENIDTVIHLGDFFDSRKSLNVLTINKGIEICKKFNDNNINLYIILGNHDQFYKHLPTPNSLCYLDLIPSIHIVDTKPMELNNYILVPWGYDITQLTQNTNILGHFEINGFVTNSSGNIQEGSNLNISDLKKFNTVTSGHFHTPSKQSNISYIGSAFPMTFNDINSQRGYYLVENNDWKFIEFTSAPKFVDIFSNQNFAEKDVKNNIVRFIFVEDYSNVNNDKLIQSVSDMNPRELYINYNIITEDNELLLDSDEFDISDNSEVIRDYIDKKEFPTYINKAVLKKLVYNLEQGE